MTTTYELYTNDNGTPKLVGGKAPAIVDRVEALETNVGTLGTSVGTLETNVGTLETNVESIQGTLNTGVVTSVNGNTGALTPEQTGCLPLSGGTMTGNIVVSGANHGIFQDATDKILIIAGSNSTHTGGSFYAVGGTNSERAGQFVCTARTASQWGYELVGKPDGTLTWGGKNIERANDISIASDNGYVRYECGLQICWGYVASVSNSNKTITFPVAFSAVPGLAVSAGATYPFTAHTVNNTSFVCYVESRISMEIRYIAIGRWK